MKYISHIKACRNPDAPLADVSVARVQRRAAAPFEDVSVARVRRLCASVTLTPAVTVDRGMGRRV